jgi:uncharacterized damage-inducible protein DinB
MLGKDMLEKLYDYNVTANTRILDCAARVSQAQFVAATDIGHGSLQGLLFHMLHTEWVWRILCQDHQIQASSAPRKEDFSTLDEIRERWQAEEQLMRAFLTSVSDDELARIVQVKRRDGTETPMVLWHMLMHCMLHSMQHRSEAAVLLTGYGQSPGDLDFIFLVNLMTQGDRIELNIQVGKPGFDLQTDLV